MKHDYKVITSEEDILPTLKSDYYIEGDYSIAFENQDKKCNKCDYVGLTAIIIFDDWFCAQCIGRLFHYSGVGVLKYED